MGGRFLPAVMFGVVVSVTGLSLAQDQPQNVDAPAVRASVFKNGVGLIVQEAQLPDRNGSYMISPVPEASFGSFWVNWSWQVQLSDIVSATVVRETTVPASNVPEILQANIGKTVELLIKDDWQRGKIIDLPRVDPADPPVHPLHLRGAPHIYPPMPTGDLLLFEPEGAGMLALPVLWVQQVRLDEQPVLTVKRSERVGSLQFKSVANQQPDANAQPADRVPAVRFVYLAQGISWMPSYVVDISQSDHAVLSAKAVLVNDLVDLKDAHVELIAGYPNLQFANIPDAMSLQPLQNVLNQLRQLSSGAGRETNMMANRMVMAQQVGYSADAGTPGMPTTPVMGEQSEDLYIYTLHDVTVAKGQRGYFPMFTSPVPYVHLYTLELPDTINADNRYVAPDEPSQQPVVWHALRLTNTGRQPWTTAPATIMQSNRVLAQSMLKYTPSQGNNDLQITQAIDIRTEHNEFEKARQRNAAQIYGSSHDLVTVQGELVLTNFKNEAVTIDVTKLISGEVKQASHDPQITKLARGLRKANPQSRLQWKVLVTPGNEQSVRVTYEYEVYVRN